jgi:Flp pilus assembly protein TadG
MTRAARVLCQAAKWLTYASVIACSPLSLRDRTRHCEVRSTEAIPTVQRTRVRALLGGDCFGASRLAMTSWRAIVGQPLGGLALWSATRRLARARQASTAVEFAICALALVFMVVGFVEFGRLVWTFEVLQEVAAEGARCMGLAADSCASGGAYSASSTTTYVVDLAASRGVTITAATVALNNAASCGGASGFSQVSINYDFTTVAPDLLTSLASGLTVSTSACFPNNA